MEFSLGCLTYVVRGSCRVYQVGSASWWEELKLFHDRSFMTDIMESLER